MAGSPITAVSAFAMHTDPQQLDTFTASLSFANGSIAGITYVSNGSKSLPKESIEIASGGLSICIDDFKSLRLYGKKAARARDGKQDKGHAAEMHAFAKAVKAGTPFPISTAESLHATLATFAVLESIRQGGVRIDLNDFENQWISAKSN
jgi:hypothetical protein